MDRLKPVAGCEVACAGVGLAPKEKEGAGAAAEVLKMDGGGILLL